MVDLELQVLTLSSLTVTEYRAFRKALGILLRAGMTRENAVSTLVWAYRKRHDRCYVESRYAETQ